MFKTYIYLRALFLTVYLIEKVQNIISNLLNPLLNLDSVEAP